MEVKPLERIPYYAAGSAGSLNTTYNLRIPEIYAVEVTNACNFTCDFCPRDQPGIRRPDTFIDLDLAKTIAGRDLGGSYFVEFQQAGEPTLHRQLPEIIELFKGKVLTGLSTNGSSVHAHRVWTGLLNLDYLTISVDSVEEYERVRPGGKWTKLVSNIDFLIDVRSNKNGHSKNEAPFIDLQLIEFPGVERQRDLLVELAARHQWNVEVRRVPDAFLSITREFREIKKKELCLNPWLSVNVQADGDVIGCCESFGKDIVYGNLRNQSLEEIWQTSEELKKMREEHLSGNLRPVCEKCYQRSPVLLHWDLYKSAVKERMLRK